MTEPSDLSLLEIIDALRRAQFSSQELIQFYLSRIEKIDPLLNVFCSLAPQSALENSLKADQVISEWRKGTQAELPPLTGVPFAVKDILCVAGMTCTCGSRILENYVPPYNATAIQRLIDNGTIVLGKTNLDEFAMGSSTENSAYGVTRNPWDLDRVPGGSSGGSAAGVSAGLFPFALGTDTGGSIRQPAAFCGITGLKPTYGRVSRYGLIAYGSSLDVVGVLGRDAADISMIYQIISGFDPLDSTSVDYPLSEVEFRSASVLEHTDKLPLKGIRIGIPEEYFVTGIQNAIEQNVKKAVYELECSGAEVIEISLPHTEYAVPVYYLVASSEASANLARYDGIRFGRREPSDTLLDLYCNTRGKYFGPEVKRRIMLGTYALSAGYYDAYYNQAQKVCTLIKKDFDSAFKRVDLIAAPVTPTTAFRIGEHSGDPLSMYLEDVYTLPANLAGIPSIAFPVGFDENKLPVGMQLMAPQFGESMLLNTVHIYQQVTGWHKYKPEIALE